MNIGLDHIVRATAAQYCISIDEIRGECRTYRIARPRMVAMALARCLTTRSTTSIGKYFKRDHSTICHAVERVNLIRRTSAKLAASIECAALTAIRMAERDEFERRNVARVGQ